MHRSWKFLVAHQVNEPFQHIWTLLDTLSISNGMGHIVAMTHHVMWLAHPCQCQLEISSHPLHTPLESIQSVQILTQGSSDPPLTNHRKMSESDMKLRLFRHGYNPHGRAWKERQTFSRLGDKQVLR